MTVDTSTQTITTSDAIATNNPAQQSKNSEGQSDFDKELEEASPDWSQTNGKPPIVDYLDKYNKFDGLAPEVENRFRKILEDNEINQGEMNGLSFQEAQLLNKVMFSFESEEAFMNSPITLMSNQTSSMLLGAVNMTNDNTFNEAIYEYYKQTPDDLDRMRFTSELGANLGQMHAGMPLQNSLIVNAYRPPLFPLEDKEDMDINYTYFFDSMQKMMEQEMERSDIHPSLRENYEWVSQEYQKLQDIYNDVKSSKEKQRSIAPYDLES